MTQPSPGTPRLLRAINDRAALQVLLERGPLTRPEIGALTGLSKPTASQLLARLQRAGLVVPNGVREGLPGRTAEVYRLNPAAAHVAALDITPGHIDVQVADITGTVIGGRRLTVPAPRAHGDHDVHGVRDAPEAAGVPGVADVRDSRNVRDTVEGVRAALEGAGVPGGLRRVVAGVRGASGPRPEETAPAGDEHGTGESVPGQHSPGLVAALGAGLGVRICVENNVNLAAWAERALGVARGRSDFALLWAGESLGSALVLGGRLHRGATGGAGEAARLPVPGAPAPRPAGPHGGHGYQALAGGPAVLAALRSYGVPGATFEQAVRNAVHDAEGTERHAGDARAGLRDVAARLAVGLASIVSVVDPELVVLAGGTFLAGGEPLRALVERELYELTGARPPLLLSAVEGNPVLAGALDLALTATREEVFGSTAPV
ncbi:hypothetical protein GCM10017673_23700 [Streptosporangium violaceochromogenes]|nr:hypothetical protein GCM10017673_23700 [Streptosporangium violaceochromogenes]